MISVVLDRPKTPPACFPKPENVPQTEAPSLACADMGDDRPRPSREPAASAFAVIEALIALARVWRERSRTRRRLAAMSERELQDMGICQSEIADEIGKPFWRSFEAANARRADTV